MPYLWSNVKNLPLMPNYSLNSTLPNFEKKLCGERSCNVLHVRILLLVRCSHIDTYSHRVTNSNRFYDKMQWSLNYYFIAQYSFKHLSKTGIIDDFQSAYKAGHSCATALLRVFKDIASTIEKGNGILLVLLDLSAAFDTIDHVILFAILKKVYRFRW